MNIAIYITAAQKGFLISVGKTLAREHNIIFIARDKDVESLIQRLTPELADRIEVVNDYDFDFSNVDIVSECRRREQKYNTLFSFLMGQDRALGKGYVFNADKHPDIKRSWWPHKKKLKAVLERFHFIEDVIEKYSINVFMSLHPDIVFSVVCKAEGIPYISIASAKYGNRLLWSDNNYYTSSKYIETIKKYAAKDNTSETASDINYELEFRAKRNRGLIDYSYRGAIKQALLTVIRDTYKFTRRNQKKDAYRYLGWIPYILRAPKMHDYFLRYGKRPEELKNFRIVVFPLHNEPEIALMSHSPEFNNSMEVIAWVSKALPANSVLVIKEQPFAFGVRSRHYYDNLRRISNVVLAHPEVISWDWIKACKIVVAITGTAGIEAVYFKKPVLSFGVHQAINHLPTVKYINNYESAREWVKAFLEMKSDDKRFRISKAALYTAQIEASFELPGWEKLGKSQGLHMKLAEEAVKELKLQHPDLSL